MRSRSLLAPLAGLVLVVACSSSSSNTPSPTPADDAGVAQDGAPPPADGAVADVGADAPASAPIEWKSGTRLRANVVKAAGGATLFVSWHDTLLDMDCRFAKADDGQMRCLPITGAAIAYSDGACSVPLIGLSPCGAAPKMVSVGSADGCSVTAYQTTAKLSAPIEVHYKNGGGACGGAEAPGAIDFYDGSVPVGTSELLSATVKEEARSADLVVRILTAADGTIDARTFAAGKRGYECELSSIVSPPKHCLPRTLAYSQGFAESTCTTRAALQPTACGFTPALVQKDGTLATCDFFGESSFAEVGPEVTGSVYSKSATCVAQTKVPGARYWTQGADVPTSSLPAIASKDEGTDRLRVHALTAATGERLLGTTFFDSQRNELCSASVASDDKLRCLPPVSGLTSVAGYKDAGCTQPVLARAKGCTPPTFAATSLGLGCSSRVHYYAVGAVTSVPTLYYGSPCVAGSVDTGSDYYSLSEIPPTDFAEVTTARE